MHISGLRTFLQFDISAVAWNSFIHELSSWPAGFWPVIAGMLSFAYGPMLWQKIRKRSITGKNDSNKKL